MARHWNRYNPNRRHAFTLVELLVVTAILCSLAALLLPALKTAQDSGYSAQCANNLRQLGFLRVQWSADHNQQLVPYVGQYTWARDYNAYLPPSLWATNSATSLDQVKGIWRCELTLRGIAAVGTLLPSAHGVNSSYLVNSNLGANPGNVAMVLQDNILSTATLGTYCDTISVNLAIWNNCNMASTYPDQYYHHDKRDFLFLDGHVEALNYATAKIAPAGCPSRDLFCVIQK